MRGIECSANEASGMPSISEQDERKSLRYYLGAAYPRGPMVDYESIGRLAAYEALDMTSAYDSPTVEAYRSNVADTVIDCGGSQNDVWAAQAEFDRVISRETTTKGD
jgi:hypothetical protein